MGRRQMDWPPSSFRRPTSWKRLRVSSAACGNTSVSGASAGCWGPVGSRCRPPCGGFPSWGRTFRRCARSSWRSLFWRSSGRSSTFVFIRLRLQEARKPFRYTCSVLPFKPGEGMQAEDTLDWLAEDLAQKLSEHIGRLSFIDPKEEAKRSSRASPSPMSTFGAPTSSAMLQDLPGWQASAQASKPERLFIELDTPGPRRLDRGVRHPSVSCALPVAPEKTGRIQAGPMKAGLPAATHRI